MKKRGKGKRKAVMLLIIALAAVFVLFGYAKVRSMFWNKSYPYLFKDHINSAAGEFNVDPALILAVVKTESSFRPEVVSRAGAKGLMQITPDTFDFICYKGGFDGYCIDDLFNPEINIRLGTFFLSYLIEDFNGELQVALAAYNAGRGSAIRWLSDSSYSDDGKTLSYIPYKETRNYVEKVTSSFDTYKKLYFK